MPHPPMIRCLATAIVVVAAGAGDARAARPATPAERAEMEPTFGYQMIEARCAAATVSTADPSWSRISAIVPVPEGCAGAGQQSLILHRIARFVDPWTRVLAIPDAPVQRRLRARRRCADLAFPDAVGRDIGACVPSPGLRRGGRSRTTMTCYRTPSSTRATYERRPRRCIVKDGPGRTSRAWEVRRVRWVGWGREAARGTGVVRLYASGRPSGTARRRSFVVGGLVGASLPVGARDYATFDVAGFSGAGVSLETTPLPLR